MQYCDRLNWDDYEDDGDGDGDDSVLM